MGIGFKIGFDIGGKLSTSKYGVELVNDSSLTGIPSSFTPFTGTISYDENGMTVTTTGNGGAYQALVGKTESGKTYKVYAETTSGPNGYLLRINNGSGPAAAIVDIVPVDGKCIGEFTALSTTTTVYARHVGVGVSVWQKISVREIL